MLGKHDLGAAICLEIFSELFHASIFSQNEIQSSENFQSAAMEQLFSMSENRSMGTRVKTNFKPSGPRHFIRQWRKHRGLTQETLANRLQVAVSTISQLETGKQGYSQPMLEALARELLCEPADLLMRDPTDNSAPWSIHDQLSKAPPERQKEIMDVVTVLLRKTG